MAETKIGTTAQELYELPDDGKRYELVEGELREMAPAGAMHGNVAATLTILLGQHVRAQQSGRLLAAETGFRISRNPDTVRAPGVSFVSRERVPPEGPRKVTGSSHRIWPSRCCPRTMPPPRSSPKCRCGWDRESVWYGSSIRVPAPWSSTSPSKRSAPSSPKIFWARATWSPASSARSPKSSSKDTFGSGCRVFRNRPSGVAIRFVGELTLCGAFVHTALRARRRSEQWTRRRT